MQKLSYAEMARAGELSEQELDVLFAEHGRLGHSDDDGAGECYGCLTLEDLANMNERAKRAGK